MIGKYGKVLKGKPEEQGDGRNSDRELPRRKAEESRSPFKIVFRKNNFGETENYENRSENLCSLFTRLGSEPVQTTSGMPSTVSSDLVLKRIKK